MMCSDISFEHGSTKEPGQAHAAKHSLCNSYFATREENPILVRQCRKQLISTQFLSAEFSEHMQFFMFALVPTLLRPHHQARFNSASCFTSYSMSLPSGITSSVSGRR
jgi:hypothetical protein